MSEAAEYGEISLARFTSERFASWMIRVMEGETSNDVSALRSRKSVGKEHRFEFDQIDSENVLSQLSVLVSKVMKRAKEMGVAGRLGEVKIRYQGFETHTHGRSIPVAMDDETVFMRMQFTLGQRGRAIDLLLLSKTTFVDSHCGQYSPAHPFLVTLLPSRFQVLFIMSAKYSSLSIDIETLL